MGTMARAHKEHRKLPFLKALSRIGTIVGAAKFCRISRDAVHDWRGNDPSFERAFQNAKRRHENEPFELVESTIVMVKDVVRPVIPANLWPRITAEITLAMVNLKRDIKAGGRIHRVAPSGHLAGLSLSPEGFEDVAIPNCGSGSSALI